MSTFVVTWITVALALGLIVLAKIATLIILALSPIFIFFALYESTRGFFNSYISQLMTYALVPIITSVILMIMLTVMESCLDDLKNVSHPTVGIIMPFLLTAIAQIWLLLQVHPKCAALAGGFSLRGVLATAQHLKSSIHSMASGAPIRGLGTLGSSNHTSYVSHARHQATSSSRAEGSSGAQAAASASSASSSSTS